MNHSPVSAPAGNPTPSGQPLDVGLALNVWTDARPDLGECDGRRRYRGLLDEARFADTLPFRAFCTLAARAPPPAGPCRDWPYRATDHGGQAVRQLSRSARVQ